MINLYKLQQNTKIGNFQPGSVFINQKYHNEHSELYKTEKMGLTLSEALDRLGARALDRLGARALDRLGARALDRLGASWLVCLNFFKEKKLWKAKTLQKNN